MRAFQVYRFHPKTKIPFTEWPGIVQQFFREQGLHYEEFQYYFTHPELNIAGYRNPCKRAIAENPQLGQLDTWEHPDSKTLFYSITNIGKESGCTEAEIMRLLSKLYRRYGFSKSHLIYRNVDFFGRNAPPLLDASQLWPDHICGSCVRLYRDGIFPRWNHIELKLECVQDGRVMDTSCYRDAMAALLPGLKYFSYMEIKFTPEEQQLYTEKNETVKPLLEQAKQFLKQRTENLWPASGCRNSVSMAGILKKLCKKHGFTYLRYEYFCYFLEKRTVRGHYITLEIDTGRLREEDNALVSIKGAGFDLRLLTTSWVPYDPEATAAHYDQLFAIIKEAEQTVLLPIAEHFPETPDWFVWSE